jgi:uncharacterized protein with GYD domain
MIDYEANEEAIKKVREIDDQLQEERKKQKPDGGKMTRLMFEQLLRGLYINQFNQYNYGN